MINALEFTPAEVARYLYRHVMNRYGLQAVLIRPNGRVRVADGGRFSAAETQQLVGVYTKGCTVSDIEDDVSEFVKLSML